MSENTRFGDIVWYTCPTCKETYDRDCWDNCSSCICCGAPKAKKEQERDRKGEVTITALLEGKLTSDSIFLSTINARTEDTLPRQYRLLQKLNGTIVLQGAYYWFESSKSGSEWRDIPTEQEL
jgi:hypothetical protein